MENETYEAQPETVNITCDEIVLYFNSLTGSADDFIKKEPSKLPLVSGYIHCIYKTLQHLAKQKKLCSTCLTYFILLEKWGKEHLQ